MGNVVTYTVVKVIDDTTLVDAQSMACPYTTPRSLVPGHYVVVWRNDAAAWRYDSNAIYFGPFASEDQVRGWLKIFVDLLRPQPAVMERQAVAASPAKFRPGTES